VPHAAHWGSPGNNSSGGQKMEYLIGLILALAVAGCAALIGFDRDRAYYSTVLIVIASYYVLFAVMGAASGRTLAGEIAVATVFSIFAVLASNEIFGSWSLLLWATASLTSSITCSSKTLECRIGGPAPVWYLM